MDRKLSVVANVRYQSSKSKGASKLKGLLRYLQYRPNRDDHLPQRNQPERWVDHGLGDSFQTIAANCEAIKSEYVQAFTVVINPNPDLVALVLDERRIAFIQELTEATIDTFLAERGIEGLEYSYATHRRETTDRDLPGRDDPHTHVILPGSYYSWQDGERLPWYINHDADNNHILSLHQIAQQHIARLLDREVGLDWEQHYDLALLEREAQSLMAEIAPADRVALEVDSPADDSSPNVWLAM
jgi:hypothetical protein